MTTPVREAATVMIVRDAPDLHVFMLKRNLNSDFVGGAYVFPGGGVDQDDQSPAVVERCPDLDDVTASRLLGMDAGGLGFWVAAVRESFEEAGVLFARRADGTGVRAGTLDADRVAVAGRDLAFSDLLEREDLILDLSALHVFSHWITPNGMPRRYDTWFFVAQAPEGEFSHDDTETIASTWIRPPDALKRALRQEFEIIFPTQRNLEAIARFEAAESLLAVAGTSTIEAVQPRIINDASGVRIILPGDPGYDDVEELPDGSLAPLSIDALRGDTR